MANNLSDTLWSLLDPLPEPVELLAMLQRSSFKTCFYFPCIFPGIICALLCLLCCSLCICIVPSIFSFDIRFDSIFTVRLGFDSELKIAIHRALELNIFEYDLKCSSSFNTESSNTWALYSASCDCWLCYRPRNLKIVSIVSTRESGVEFPPV